MIKIAITQGHPGGVAGEVILKTFAEPSMVELCQPILYGSASLMEAQRAALQSETSFKRISQLDEVRGERLNVLDKTTTPMSLSFGMDTPEGMALEQDTRQQALADCQSRLVDAVVHAPSNQKLQALDGEMLVMVSRDLRVAVATKAEKEDEVTALLSVDSVVDSVKQLNNILQRDFLLTRPRIAVLSLHADDQTEETDILMPAIEQSIGNDVNAFGPFPADEFFEQGDNASYDAILALYRVQAEKTFRTLDRDDAATYLAGQDIVQTAPLQQAQLKQAGKGEAEIQPFTSALYLATDVVRNRAAFDEAHRNPLQKLYFDKREDNRR